MNHRKRSQWHHKTELSTLLKMVITKRLIKQNRNNTSSVTNSLANQAIQYLKMSEVMDNKINSVAKNVMPKAVA